MMPLPIRERLFSFFGPDALRITDRFGLRIVLVDESETYADVSPAIAAEPFGDHDPVVRGLYVPEERAIYLRNRSDGTLVHEYTHGLVDALGQPVRNDPALRAAHANAADFVSPYAFTSNDLDEWFCEGIRALLSAANGDYESISPQDFARVDPRGYELCLAMFERITSRPLSLPRAA